MGSKRNCYFFSRVAVWLSAGSMPSVTIACSTFRVNELAYRTSPTEYELISRHVSRVDDLETFQVDPSMLSRIRCMLSGFSAAVRRDADKYLQQDKVGSNWFFQPNENGWLAMFDGRPNDVRAFQQWLGDVLA